VNAPTGALDVEGDLGIEVGDGVRLGLAGGDPGLRLEVPDWRAGRQVMALLGSRQGRQRHLLHVARILAAADLRLAVRMRGLSVATLGGSRRVGVLPRLIGLAPLSIRPLALLRAIRRRAT
jgi:hypothetical protein